jgi:hypothetical protein
MSDVLNQASLILIPSGYKSGKLYSQIPENGNGDLQFTRASNATRVNSAGLIEKVRTNLLTYSEDFTNGAWFKTAASVTADATTAPNGTTTADKIFATATSGNHFVTRLSTVLTGEFTFSVFAKASEYSILKLQDVNAGVFNGTFDLSAGTASGTGAVIQSVGSGWYRCSVTYTSSGSSVANALIGAPSTSINYTGDGTSGIFVWGAQLETGVLTDYIPTTTAAVSVGMTANVPRLDYLGSSCPSLLLEPQRTNLITFSEQFDNASWTKSGSGVASAPVVVQNSSISPSGLLNADKITFNLNGGTASSNISWLYQNIVLSAGTYTFSGYIKASNSSDIGKQIRIGGNLYNLDITLTSEWQRFQKTETISSSATYSYGFRTRGTEITNTVSLYLWGAQLEAGSYATSYIPTLGTSVTRVADAASKTGISSLIGQTEGTLFVEVDYSTLSGLDMFLSIRPDASNKVEVYRDGAIIYGEITASSSFAIALTKAVGTHKIAFAYKSGSSALYIDGVLAGQDTTAFSFTSSLVDIAINARSGGSFNEAANYKQVLLFKTRLSNTELAQLTTI